MVRSSLRAVAASYFPQAVTGVTGRMNRAGGRPDRRAGTSIAWRTPTMGALPSSAWRNCAESKLALGPPGPRSLVTPVTPRLEAEVSSDVARVERDQVVLLDVDRVLRDLDRVLPGDPAEAGPGELGNDRAVKPLPSLVAEGIRCVPVHQG